MNSDSTNQIVHAPSLPWSRPVRRKRFRVLQLNLGRYCNLACRHCHVEAGPARKEMLSVEARYRILAWIGKHRPEVVDLTGGSPELIPGFREIVQGARAARCRVIDRCNLAALLEKGQDDLAEFLAAWGVEVVASLPCYLADNVDRQRGRGTYDRSILGLQALNAVGYGVVPALPLYLVYNPVGAHLPPAQQALESEYRKRLRDDWGIEFTSLWCLANVPITRYRDDLERRGLFQDYEQLLLDAFNPATLPGLMCRDTLSVDHDGRVFDCDFNLALDLPLRAERAEPRLWDIDPSSIEGAQVVMGRHCLACTAGHGSSCQGSLAE